MPDKDVLAAVGGKSEELLHRATDNLEICQQFMAFVSLCAIEANKRGSSLGGTTVSSIIMNGHTLRAKVRFSRIVVPRTIMLAPNTKRLVDFLHTEAEGLYIFIQHNTTFVTFLDQLVSIIDTYARDKSLEYSEIKFAKTFMDNEDNVIMEIEQGA